VKDYSTSREKLETLHALVLKHYPGLWPAVQGALAVFGAMSLSGRARPLTLIFEGTSGSGKTTVLQMAFPKKDSELEKYVYRSDKFTPKAFVSHAGNTPSAKLAKIDMLPRIENKVLITKELAALFRCRKEELAEIFGILTSILDGTGLLSDSGIQGQRGYGQKIIFNWLGASTPIPRSVHQMMSQLGNRFLFFEMVADHPSEIQLVAFIENEENSKAQDECQTAMNDLLTEFFRACPVGTVSAGNIQIPSQFSASIARWANFLAHGRAQTKTEKLDNAEAFTSSEPAESPYRIVEYFKDLARGHALMMGRSEVTEEEIGLIAHVAISSIPRHIRPIVRELQRSGVIDTSKCQEIFSVSKPTARKYLAQVEALGIAELTKGDSKTNSSDAIHLSKDFHWLLSGSFPASTHCEYIGNTDLERKVGGEDLRRKEDHTGTENFQG
jgi:hypothetical protein